MLVNVPGKTRKPARRIQVNAAARIVCRRGMVSCARSIVTVRGKGGLVTFLLVWMYGCIDLRGDRSGLGTIEYLKLDWIVSQTELKKFPKYSRKREIKAYCISSAHYSVCSTLLSSTISHEAAHGSSLWR